ncbi:ATP-binding protein [Desulfobacterales bacterium HSG17]|nr:ATP-binding protein [Desulfobacterales bacterium HSG17]
MILANHRTSCRKGLTFHIDFATDLPMYVYIDAKRLRQILINILGNGINFTKTGEVIFKVIYSKSCNQDMHHQGPDAQTAPRLRFQVEDTGLGIPPDHLKDIFSSFHQVESSLNHTKGTGLGLAISQRLARMMGSEIYITSTVGQGSRFWFDIDLYKKEASCQMLYKQKSVDLDAYSYKPLNNLQ